METEKKQNPLGMIAGAAGAGVIDSVTQGIMNRVFQKQQIKSQKEMGKFNQGLALDMWQKTNYDAQRREMEKAGLNVGLMYGGTGGGGTTSTPTGSVSSAVATKGETGMGMQLALMIERQKAEIENIKADTKVKEQGVPIGKAEEALKGIQAGKESESINLLKEQTANTKTQGSILELEKKILEVDERMKRATEFDQLNISKALVDQAIESARMIRAQAGVAEATKNNQIRLTGLAVTEAQTRIAAAKAGINLTNEQVQEVGQKIMNMQVGLSQEERKIRIAQIANEYMTGTEAQNKRNAETVKIYVNMLSDMVGAIMGGE